MDLSTPFASARPDPNAPLPPPPDPWRPSEMPERRDRPPYLMTDMIEAEPEVAVRVLETGPGVDGSVARLASVVRDCLRRREPVVTTGCGTSEHAAMAIADQLSEAAVAAGLDGAAVRSEQALEVALLPPTGGLVIAVSHEGGSAATNDALEGARATGARLALITAAAGSPGAALAEPALLIATRELDQSWCHTVAYLSPIVVGAALAARIRVEPLDPSGVRALLAAPLADTTAIDGVAERLAGVERLVVIGSGADRPAARELVLKVEEGAALPAAYRDLETFLHGHLAGVDERTGLVLLLTDRRGLAARVARARQLLAAVHELRLPSAVIVSADAVDGIPHALTPAGRMVVPDGIDLPATTASSLATAVPLQLLAERLARARGRNPDPIRRDEPRYAAAAAAAE